jgi:tetratricopeptide (TPR) repeat protein
MAASLATPLADLRDFVGVSLGFRRLAADLAWIQTLQYYGTHEDHDSDDGHGHGHGGHDYGAGRYPLFTQYCERVARLDPYFTYVYYYGGGALGWNLGRLEEAESLLQLGIRNNPSEWRLPQYLAALSYQKNHDVANIVTFLEGFIGQDDCPNLLRALLANIYKKQKRYRDSIRVWQFIMRTGEPDYVNRGQQQIAQMLPLAQRQGAYSTP